MKTLDSVITRLLENGEKQSVSAKCVEMDREVISYLATHLAVAARQLYVFSTVCILFIGCFRP